MKYYLFAGDVYYARGGGRDIMMMSEILEELIKHGESLICTNDREYPKYEWYHITDEDIKIIHKSKKQAHF
jgi:hypothetical protein